MEEFIRYTKEYEKSAPRAVHHSKEYRDIEKPAYRLIKEEYMRLLPILEALADMQLKQAEMKNIETKPLTIAIDGRCASGKSTMAQMLSEITGASVIHMDDFFLPMELRTEERLLQAGGNIHYERFAKEVLSQLKKNKLFSYRRFDCSKMQLGEPYQVAANLICIVEGAYSCHPIFGEYADLKVFSEVEEKEQRIRIRNRNGEEFLSQFIQSWIPMEEKYFSAFSIKEKADIIV